jgi:CBS domain-containing protein
MKTSHHPITVADYMQRDLVTIGPEDTLRTALMLMTQNHISALPVVDTHCRCIGVITSSDILSYEQENSDESGEGRMVDLFDPESQQWESVPISVFDSEGLDVVPVSEMMARQLVWVDRNTAIRDASRRMIDERVHRILIMDEAFRLYGILSATDIVRFVAET